MCVCKIISQPPFICGNNLLEWKGWISFVISFFPSFILVSCCCLLQKRYRMWIVCQKPFFDPTLDYSRYNFGTLSSDCGFIRARARAAAALLELVALAAKPATTAFAVIYWVLSDRSLYIWGRFAFCLKKYLSGFSSVWVVFERFLAVSVVFQWFNLIFRRFWMVFPSVSVVFERFQVVFGWFH